MLLDSIDTASLIVGFIVGSVGFVLLVYGKRQSRIPHLAVGLLMMVYPFFVANWILSAAIFVALCLALYAAVRFGW